MLLCIHFLLGCKSSCKTYKSYDVKKLEFKPRGTMKFVTLSTTPLFCTGAIAQGLLVINFVNLFENFTRFKQQEKAFVAQKRGYQPVMH